MMVTINYKRLKRIAMKMTKVKKSLKMKGCEMKKKRINNSPVSRQPTLTTNK